MLPFPQSTPGRLPTDEPALGYGVLFLGVFLFGASTYTRFTMRDWTHWRDLSVYKKVITAIPVVAGIGFMILVSIAGGPIPGERKRVVDPSPDGVKKRYGNAVSYDDYFHDEDETGEP